MRMPIHTCVPLLATVGLLMAVPAASASDDPPCSSTWVGCGTTRDVAYVKLMPREEVLALEKFPGDDGKPIIDRPKEAPRYEYLSLNDCPQAKPDSITEQVSCAHALRDCPEGELGPL